MSTKNQQVTCLNKNHADGQAHLPYADCRDPQPYGRCDFIYEWQLKDSPLDEEQAEKVLRWLSINPMEAKRYSGVSTCRAVLIIMSKGLYNSLYPPEYQTTGFDRQ